MNRVRKYRPDVKLQHLLKRPGGLTVDEALANAEKALESLRAQCTNAVDEKIEVIATLAVADGYDVAEIYALADEIFALAGTFGMLHVSRAAYSLCALLSSDEGARKSAAIRVHVEALRALRNPEVASDGPAAARVLEGLVAVSKRYAKPETETKAPGA